jgi:hypothetical protein
MSKKCEKRTNEEIKTVLTGWVSGSITNDLRLIACLARVAAYSLGKRSCSSREHANDMGLAASLISKIQSSLSMRGTIRR